MRVLIIADYLPYPLIGGDRIRIYNLLRRVAARHEVYLAAFLERPEDAEGVPHLEQFCARVETASFKKSSRLSKMGPRYAERFDACTTVSESDKNLLIKANRRLQVDVIPNGVDIEKYQSLPENHAEPSLLFIGNMGYQPCADAVVWFCREILP